MKKKIGLTALLFLLSLGSSFASDHDDGEADLKGRSLNLTDVYAFREDKEIMGGSPNHLIFIINSNPRSLPEQQYFFSTQARYDLNIGRVGTSIDVPAKTTENIRLRVEFSSPDSQGKQAISLTTTIDGTSQIYSSKDGGGAIQTTPLANATLPIVSDVTVNTHVLQIFAGLRKDPFFFDVTAFFRFRAAAARTGGALPVPGFAAFPTYTPDGVSARDFTSQYNANSIAIRVPIAFLQSSGQTVFDLWASVSVPQ